MGSNFRNFTSGFGRGSGDGVMTILSCGWLEAGFPAGAGGE